MKTVYKVLLILIAVLIIGGLCSKVLFLAEDTSEGTPGVDMAALWSVNTGLQWIYPGSSTNAEGTTLHNIHLMENKDPYQGAKEIIQHSYNVTPNICVTMDNNASELIFGDVITGIREYDWGEGYTRGTAVEKAVQDKGINYFGIIPALFTGHIKIFFI